MNPWGLRGGGAGCWPCGRALMGLTLGCLGLPGPRRPPLTPASLLEIKRQTLENLLWV